MTARCARSLVKTQPLRPHLLFGINRYMTTSVTSKQTMMNSTMQPKFSEGQDESELTVALDTLIENGWNLDDERRGVRKTYYLKTYTKVMDLHNIIGVRSKSRNHHPEMTSKAGSLTVLWTTHQPRGLSADDVFMAKNCDEQAKMIGTVDQSGSKRCGPGPAPPI